MYNMYRRIVPKKTILSFERGGHIEFKDLYKNEFDFFRIPLRGAKPENVPKMTLKDLYVTFEPYVDL